MKKFQPHFDGKIFIAITIAIKNRIRINQPLIENFPARFDYFFQQNVDRKCSSRIMEIAITASRRPAGIRHFRRSRYPIPVLHSFSNGSIIPNFPPHSQFGLRSTWAYGDPIGYRRIQSPTQKTLLTEYR